MTAGTSAPPSAARDRILDTAFRLFYARACAPSASTPIIAESGVAKATFYKHFPAKDDLIAAYLDKVDQAWTGQLHAAAAPPGRPRRDQLVGLFDALDSACRRDGYRGCGFINAAAESPPGTTRTTAPSPTSAGAGVDHRPGPRGRGRHPTGSPARSRCCWTARSASGALDADPEAAATARSNAAALLLTGRPSAAETAARCRAAPRWRA